MAQLQALLDEYSESHQNPTNKLIHWLCVPSIVWSVIALLWVIPFPAALGIGGYPLNWAVVVLVLAQIYYFRKSLSLGAGLLLVNLVLLWLVHWVAANVSFSLWKIGLAVFVIAWIIQFVGHEIEGKKPSFFKDLQFLLIGPAWLMSFVYRKLGVAY